MKNFALDALTPLVIVIVFMILLVSCNSVEQPLTEEEKEKIKDEVIADIEKHVKDIVAQDYEKVMPFYVKEDYILYGDGKYWGDYETIDNIWKKALSEWKVIKKWDMKNHKVYVYSRDAAVDYVEWEHERINADGDTTRGYGSWVWGMKRFPEGWRSVSAAVDHRYEK